MFITRFDLMFFEEEKDLHDRQQQPGESHFISRWGWNSVERVTVGNLFLLKAVNILLLVLVDHNTPPSDGRQPTLPFRLKVDNY